MKRVLWTFRIAGMRDIRCAQTLQAALHGIPGVSAYVSYKKAFAEIEAPEDIPLASFEEAIRNLGYRAEPT